MVNPMDRETLELILDLGARLGRGEIIGQTPYAGRCWAAIGKLETHFSAARRPDREEVARVVYETWFWSPDFVPWVVGGNSDKQFDARKAADGILALFSPTQAKGGE